MRYSPMTMAKHTLFRKIGSRHEDEEVAALEDELLEAVNALPVTEEQREGIRWKNAARILKLDESRVRR